MTKAEHDAHGLARWLLSRDGDLARLAGAELQRALEDNERLREALEKIRDHRKSCRKYDDDMGHEPRDFDVLDVLKLETLAQGALKGDMP